MGIVASRLPQDILGSIFSYLNPQDLGRAAQVCQSWRAAQEQNWVWQNVTRSILDMPTPTQDSWKRQCQVLCRWKTGRPKEIVRFPIELPVLFEQIIYDRRADYTVLEDSSSLELVQLDPRSSSVFSVRNLADEKPLKKIDLKLHGCDGIADSALYGTTWTIVDIRGKIFQFDISTAACINNQFSMDVEPDRLVTIHSNDQEIVSTVGNKVYVWDLQQRRLVHSFEVSEILEILRIRSTKNFVLCFARTATNDCVIAINKIDPVVQIRIDVQFAACSLESSSSYYSFLTRGGDLHIYRDTADAQLQVVAIHHIFDIPDQGFTSVQMYRNWVGVNKGGELRLFDVRTGHEIGVLQNLLQDGDSFRINAEALVVRHIRLYLDLNMHMQQDKVYSLCDFGRRVQRMPTENMREREIRLSCCSLQ